MSEMLLRLWKHSNQQYPNIYHKWGKHDNNLLLERIITCDKKWILYDNQHRIEQCLDKGALDLTTMTAKDALVPLDQVFMLSDSSTLDQDTIHQILLLAHSRIPIYRGTEKRLIQGLLLTKMLLQYNTLETVHIRTLMQNDKCYKPLRYVTETTPLYDLLQLFKTGRTGHMAVVVKDNIADEQLDAIARFHSVTDETMTSSLVSVFPPVIGIITLEDVLEKLIQSEIQDEGDIFRNDTCRQLVCKNKIRWAKVFRGQPENKSKSMGSNLINEMENDTKGNSISQKYLDDHALLMLKNYPKNYRTFMERNTMTNNNDV